MLTVVNLFTPRIHNPWVSTFIPNAKMAEGTTIFFHRNNSDFAPDVISPEDNNAMGGVDMTSGIVRRVIGGERVNEVNVEERELYIGIKKGKERKCYIIECQPSSSKSIN